MFRSFLRFFGPRQTALLGAFATYKLAPHLATSEENERINQKLKKKLNEKYHNRKDISFELTDEFRYFHNYPDKIWSSSVATPTKPSRNRSQTPSKSNWAASRSDDSTTEKSASKSETTYVPKTYSLSSQPVLPSTKT